MDTRGMDCLLIRSIQYDKGETPRDKNWTSIDIWFNGQKKLDDKDDLIQDGNRPLHAHMVQMERYGISGLTNETLGYVSDPGHESERKEILSSRGVLLGGVRVLFGE